MALKFKSNTLVIVQAKGYQHYGEVVSERHAVGDNHTHYLVRRVPGEENTIEDVAEYNMRPPDSSRRSYDIHYAIVASKFKRQPLHGFPVDMLRYDFAAPLNFELVENHRGFISCEIDKSFGRDDLIVATLALRRGNPWTPERWESFMWSITPLKVVRFERQR